MTVFSYFKLTFEHIPGFHCTISIKDKDLLLTKICLLYQMLCEAMVDEVLCGTDKLQLHLDNISP